MFVRVENGVTKFSPKKNYAILAWKFRSVTIVLPWELGNFYFLAAEEPTLGGGGGYNFETCYSHSVHPGAYTNIPQPALSGAKRRYTEKSCPLICIAQWIACQAGRAKASDPVGWTCFSPKVSNMISSTSSIIICHNKQNYDSLEWPDRLQDNMKMAKIRASLLAEGSGR